VAETGGEAGGGGGGVLHLHECNHDFRKPWKIQSLGEQLGGGTSGKVGLARSFERKESMRGPNCALKDEF